MRKGKLLFLLFGLLTLTSCELPFLEHTHDYSYEIVGEENGHYKKCECGEISGLEEHSWKKAGEDIYYVTTLLPTTTTLGQRYKICSICSYKEYESIDKLCDHNFTELHTSSSQHWYACSKCGQENDHEDHDFETKYDENNHYQRCKDCLYETNHEAHTFTEFISKQATSTEQGILSHNCGVCNYSYDTNFGETEKIVYTVSNYYGGYYSSLSSWEDSDDLKSKLHNIIKTVTPLSYTNEPSQIADEDLYVLEYVNPVYSDQLLLKTQTGTGGWDKEHAFCASLMTGTDTGYAVSVLGRATDYHNLFASESGGNRSRSNNNYCTLPNQNGVLTDRTTQNGQDGYKALSQTGTGITYWEPGNVDKGRLSRALCYMTVMYTEDIAPDNVNNYNTMKALRLVDGNVEYSNNCTRKKPDDNTSKPISANTAYTAYAHGNASDIYTWAKRDVDLVEYKHNEMIYRLQGNRNPFVDYPELIDYCFGDKKDEAGELKYLKPSYVSLGMGDNDFAYYALESYPHTCLIGETLDSTKFNLVKVNNKFEKTPSTGINIEGWPVDGFTTKGTKELTINTPINSFKVNIDVVDPDCNYKANITCSSGDPLYSLKTAALGVDHECTFNGVKWNVNFTGNTPQGNSTKYGAKFGTSAKPCSTITFTSKEDFTFDSKSNINQIHFEGASASGCAYMLKFYINDEQVFVGNVTYDTVTSPSVDYILSTPKTGKVKIEISSITNACYVKCIGVNTID